VEGGSIPVRSALTTAEIDRDNVPQDVAEARHFMRWRAIFRLKAEASNYRIQRTLMRTSARWLNVCVTELWT